MTVLLIGAGRMGSALLGGWRAKGIKPIFVVEPNPSPQIRRLARDKAFTLVPSLSALKGRKIRACVVAIKPQVLKGEAPSLAAVAEGGTLMISIAAGTSVAALQKAWGRKARIIRAMPNIPGAIGQGITGLYAARGTTAADRSKANELLSALGETLWVKTEKLIDSVTALSGSGPAYVFHLVEAMTTAGIRAGLKQADARKLARATVAGAGALLLADQTSATALRQAVTSPGGTTAAALAVLIPELSSLMTRTVMAAKKRAEELR